MKATGDIAVYRSLRHGNQPTVSCNSLYRGYPFRYLESIGSEYGENIPMRQSPFAQMCPLVGRLGTENTSDPMVKTVRLILCVSSY
jgi:hypothetical protein